MALNGEKVAICGRFKGHSHASIGQLIVRNGGKVAKSTDADIKHIVASDVEVGKAGGYVDAAKQRGAQIISLDCLLKNGSDAQPTPQVSGQQARPEKRPRGALSDTEEKSDPSSLPKRKVPKKKEALAKKTKVVVDEQCPASVKSTHHVFQDEHDQKTCIYDAALNQSNIGANANKFYNIQLLESNDSDSTYAVFTRWGRVGETGMDKLEQNLDLVKAKALFCKKFKDKTGLLWEKRNSAPKSGKYTVIEKLYEEEDEAPSAFEDSKEGQGSGSKLRPEIRELADFIFNQKHMEASMESMNYNYKKLPLGKLSQRILERGNLVLTDLNEVILDPTLAQSKYKMTVEEVLNDLTSKYYTVIPHAFGRSRPPVIDTEAMLKTEIELIETLGNLEISHEIMKASNQSKDTNALDAQFASLGLEEITPLEPASDEYKNLESCFHHSKSWHTSSSIEHIYRVTRPGEAEGFRDAGFSADAMSKGAYKCKDSRYLLWHGSRGGNWGGILSKGLRIAPPEAPINNHSFGKGLYFADRACKSLCYTDPWLTGNSGLVMLCEVQIGDPPYVRTWHESTAAQSAAKLGLISAKMETNKQNNPPRWMDAAGVSPRLTGAMMADHTVPMLAPYGFENEYIVYSTKQVQVRYVFKVKWSEKPLWGIG